MTLGPCSAYSAVFAGKPCSYSVVSYTRSVNDDVL